MKTMMLSLLALAVPVCAQAQLQQGAYLSGSLLNLRRAGATVTTASGATAGFQNRPPLNGTGFILGYVFSGKTERALALEWGVRSWSVPTHLSFFDANDISAHFVTVLVRSPLARSSRNYFGYGLGGYDVSAAADIDKNFPNRRRLVPGLCLMGGGLLTRRIFWELRETVLPDFDAS